MRTTPCPINEKDLCSDVLFEDLFDGNSYCCNRYGAIIGFINSSVAKVTYKIGSNVVHVKMLEQSFPPEIKSRVEQWLDIICSSVNENSLDESIALQASLTYSEDNHSYKIVFEYILNE